MQASMKVGEAIYSQQNTQQNPQHNNEFTDENKKDDKGGSLDNIKTRIADAVAQNKIMIGHNHFYDLGKGDFVILTDYLNKVNELLNWCDEKNIEIKTFI